MAQLFDNAVVLVEGKVVSFLTRLSLDYLSSDELVHFLGGGTGVRIALAAGARYSALTWSMAVPTETSSQLSFVRRYVRVETTRLGFALLGGSRRVDTKGWLVEPRFSGAVGQSLEYSCRAFTPSVEF